MPLAQNNGRSSVHKRGAPHNGERPCPRRPGPGRAELIGAELDDGVDVAALERRMEHRRTALGRGGGNRARPWSPGNRRGESRGDERGGRFGRDRGDPRGIDRRGWRRNGRGLLDDRSRRRGRRWRRGHRLDKLRLGARRLALARRLRPAPAGRLEPAPPAGREQQRPFARRIGAEARGAPAGPGR